MMMMMRLKMNYVNLDTYKKIKISTVETIVYLINTKK